MSVAEQDLNLDVMDRTPAADPARSPFARKTGVLYIIDQLCERGGAELVLVRMINRLPRDRFEPIVVTFKIDESLGFRDAMKCAVHVLPLHRTYDVQAFRVALQIRSLIRSNNIRIAHTFHETADLWGAPVARLSGCPILISSRRDMGFLRSGKHWGAYRWMARVFTQVQAVSEEVRRFCIDKDGLDPARVITVYNGVDVTPRSQPLPDRQLLRQRFGLSGTGPLVVSVGHIRQIKGYDVFLRAAAQAMRRRPDAIYAVAGDFHEREHADELRRLAGSLGIEKQFHFLGPVSNPRELLAAADVFCLLSRTEGLSNALLEAMASELPCIATRVGGNAEVVEDGKTGFIVENGDANAAATALGRLLTDPAMARKMGAEGARRVASHFTTEVMMRNIVDSYDQLLSARCPVR